jgi:Uma2 family endonuclease
MSSGVLMVAEVVSQSSVHRDLVEKPRLYALGRVPLYLLIDSIAECPAVTVFSDDGDGAYRSKVEVAIGTPVRLPEPMNFELDTSIFKR